jgi:hypothetical protein
LAQKIHAAGLAIGALMGGGIAALQKKDILQGALMGGVGGALGGAFMPGIAGAAGATGASGASGSLSSLGTTTAGAANLFGAAGGAGGAGAGAAGGAFNPLAAPGVMDGVTGAISSGGVGGAGAGSGMFSGGIGNFLSQNKYALMGGGLGGMMASDKEPDKPSGGYIYDMSFSQERNPLFGQPGQQAFINQGYKTNSITPVEEYKPTMTAANGGIVALAEGGGLETQRYERPIRPMAPEVAAYNAQLMERANQQYNVNLRPAPNQVPGSVGYIAPPAPKAPAASTTESISGLTFNPVTQQFEGEFKAPGDKKKTSLFDTDDAVQQPYYNHSAGDSAGGSGAGANGGLMPKDLRYNQGGLSSLGNYSDGGQLLKGPGDGVSDSIPARIGSRQPARLADGEFVVPARIVSELGNGSTDAGAKRLYAMMERVQNNRKKTVGKGKVAIDSKARKMLPA